MVSPQKFLKTITKKKNPLSLVKGVNVISGVSTLFDSNGQKITRHMKRQGRMAHSKGKKSTDSVLRKSSWQMY